MRKLEDSSRRENRGVVSYRRAKQKMLILGAGFFAQEVADLLASVPDYELVGFVEGLDRGRCRQPLLHLPVYWIDDVGALGGSCKALCAVGSTERL